VKVAVIGAGVIGVSTAYFLRLRGHEVTVIERETGPGLQTSFANGALVTPSMPEPWNTPGCWRVLLASLPRSDAPLQLRLRALPDLMVWGIKFLRSSNPTRYRENTVRNVRLALFSLKVLQDLRRETHIEYGATTRGSLKLFRSAEALNAALHGTDHLLGEGLKLRRLSKDETIQLEPALAPIADQLAGAIHYAADETGDAHSFCDALAAHARQRGVNFSFGTSVSRLHVDSGRLTGVQTDKGLFIAEQYIVAAGSYSTPLLQPLGISFPVRPAKGYSLTFDGPDSTGALSIPIVDDDMHAAIVPVGNATRVAGTAEFAGFDLTLRPERVRNLTNLAQKILPHAGLDPATARPWCGLRPMSADGVPIIGATPIPNLWVNSGHGHLGWTMAAGSGQLLAELISGEAPSIDLGPYALTRFQRD
jgi:D-amino-acid dehydrogenase